MRRAILVIAASIVAWGCGGSGDAGRAGPAQPQTAAVSCLWGATCDQYTGQIDPTFASIVETTCVQHGVAYANGPCPTADQVAGHCSLGSIGGAAASYYYYGPTWTGATAQADCQGSVVGVTWVP